MTVEYKTAGHSSVVKTEIADSRRCFLINLLTLSSDKFTPQGSRHATQVLVIQIQSAAKSIYALTKSNYQITQHPISEISAAWR